MIAKASACKAAPPGGRLSALVVSAVLAWASPSLPLGAAGPDSHDVALSIANAGGEPLRCQILFAHFVVTEAGIVPPGGDLAIAMSRQDSDGALWIARADGRRMMIETIECAAAARWAGTRGQIPLLPARAGRDARYATLCRLHGAVVCEDLKPLP
ncbi:MAG TPA: hypothetical protein VLV76_01310 [Candidatus Acidoferrum sp.]|nr:hypothetical protein [Candidatus Acidoferrum sp.]